MLTLDIKEFVAYKETVTFYFMNTDDYTIISVPDWNWCYKVIITDDDMEIEADLTTALMLEMDGPEENKLRLTEEIWEFLVEEIN